MGTWIISIFRRSCVVRPIEFGANLLIKIENLVQ
jgi:hypothetical protein